MPGERVGPGHIRSIWAPSQRERDALTEGLNVEVEVFGEPLPAFAVNVTHEGATVLQRRAVVLVDRYISPDGLWNIRLLAEHGAELCASRKYKHGWTSWLALQRLKRIFPAIVVLPS